MDAGPMPLCNRVIPPHMNRVPGFYSKRIHGEIGTRVKNVSALFLLGNTGNRVERRFKLGLANRSNLKGKTLVLQKDFARLNV